MYVTFKSWKERGSSQDLQVLYKELNDIANKTINAQVMVVVPPPIQGLGLSGGFQLQIEVTDGTFNYQKLQDATDSLAKIAREQREDHDKSIIEAAVIGARTRFRPIIMTSFAFILGVMPLVLASGAGANARKSIGIAVASGMIASTCIAVVLVPSFYVWLQTWEEKRSNRNKHKKVISNNILSRIEKYFK